MISFRNRTSALVARYHTLSTIKKAIIIGATVLIIGLIIFGIVRAVSNRAPQTEVSKIHDTSADTFNASSLTQKTVVEKGANGVTVTINHPVTGTTRTDEAIVAKVTELAKNWVKNTTASLTFSSRGFAYDEYFFVTVANNDLTSTIAPTTTLVFTQKGEFTKSLFDKKGYEKVITDKAVEQISNTYKTPAEKSLPVIQAAIAAKSYRLASNGLVLQVPSAPIGAKDIGVSFYEVLIPNEIIKEYLD